LLPGVPTTGAVSISPLLRNMGSRHRTGAGFTLSGLVVTFVPKVTLRKVRNFKMLPVIPYCNQLRIKKTVLLQPAVCFLQRL
jgi:hypothetical protein